MSDWVVIHEEKPLKGLAPSIGRSHVRVSIGFTETAEDAVEKALGSYPAWGRDGGSLWAVPVAALTRVEVEEHFTFKAVRR